MALFADWVFLLLQSGVSLQSKVITLSGRHASDGVITTVSSGSFHFGGWLAAYMLPAAARNLHHSPNLPVLAFSPAHPRISHPCLLVHCWFPSCFPAKIQLGNQQGYF